MNRDWRQWLFNLAVVSSLMGLLLSVIWWEEGPNLVLLFQTPTPVQTPTPIAAATATLTPAIVSLSFTPRTTPTPFMPTPTSTPVVKIEVYEAATVQAEERTIAQASEEARAMALLQTRLDSRRMQLVSHTRESRLVLAQYFAWFDATGWDNCNISAGDKPLQPYHSDDPATIAHHIRLAREAGLDGFLLHWFAPGDRTDHNFNTLLALSRGQKFYSTVVFSRHIWHGPAPTQQSVVEAIRYLMDNYSSQPNFLYLENKPVLFFIDVYRTPADQGQTPPQFWAAVRDEVDPQRQAWWIAEGLDDSYLQVFDGLFVFKITHAGYPNDYLKSSRWAGRVRQWEQQTGQPKLWFATISPGWDDLRAGCKVDVRVPNQPHRREREDGDLYQATFEAALKSEPDWLILNSFNEWVEGTYIEPSVLYGDKYMELTRELTRRFKGESN